LALVTGALPLAWLAGASLPDLARVFGGLLCLIWLCVRAGWLELSRDPELPRGLVWAYGALALLGPFALAAHLGAKLELGLTGKDFAIVSQLVDSASRRGELATSLLGGGWRPFLSHHFTPAFFVLGFVARTGLQPAHVLVVFNALVLLGTAVAVFCIARHFGFTRGVATVAVGLFVANPVIRTSFAWSLHDEHLALPALAWAYWAFLRRRFGVFSVCLLALALCKESLLCVAAVFAAVAALRAEEKPVRRSLALLAGALGVGFALYVFAQPWLFGKAFDHLNKLPTVAGWFSPSALAGKALWLGVLLLPVAFLPLTQLRRRETWELLAPAAPLVGIIGVSAFAQMWKPFNYYAVLPTLAVSIAALEALSRLRFNAIAVAVGAALAFSFGPHRPAATVLRALDTPPRASLEAIPARATVAASEGALPRLFHTASPRFLHEASAADLVVTEDSAPMSWGEPCLEHLQGWAIRCRPGFEP
jgi:uncharacterized membrane protein